MARDNFYQRVTEKVNTVLAPAPLDLALMGVPLDEAACIDLDHAVRAIAPIESQAVELSFNDLTSALPPLADDNIFVQFKTSAAEIHSQFPGWLGVHIVSFDLARYSQLFLQLDEIPARVESWPMTYAMVIYREWPLDINLAPAGMLLGLTNRGAVIDAALFPVTGESNLHAENAVKGAAHLTAWIVYLTFCVFTMVNQGEAPIYRLSPRMWSI